jgi:hypothetical protein
MNRKPRYYWSYEKCKEISLKYKTRKELINSDDRSCYDKIVNKKWYELLEHMKYIENGFYIIYVYEFSDNYAYVGITRNRKKKKIIK